MEVYIIGYTRDGKGKIQNYHLKTIANTLHTGGGNTAQYVLELYDIHDRQSVDSIILNGVLQSKTRLHEESDAGHGEDNQSGLASVGRDNTDRE